MNPAPIEFPVEGLVGGAIRLRLGADSDQDALVRACQDAAIQRYTTVPDGYTEAHAREFGRQSALGLSSGKELRLVVADVDTDEVLGTVAIRQESGDEGRWSVGYWVAPWARRRGVATTAVELLTQFGFSELQASAIELTAEPENVGSVCVAERAGFRRHGPVPGGIVIKGEAREADVYRLLPPGQN